MVAIRTRTVRVFPKQALYLRSDARECGYSGAWRAGKTRALCLKVAARASVPGARELLCRDQLTDLKSTTLRVLLEPEGDLPPVLPPEAIESHNKSDRIIKLRGGGEIYYFGARDARQSSKGGQHKAGSVTATGVNIDEVVELDERSYLWLLSRVSLKVEGLTPQVNWATNPGPPSHFLAERFGLAPGHQAEPGRFVVSTSAYDNPTLTPEYREMLDGYTGLMRKRYVLGQWVGSDSLVYDGWDRQLHVVRREFEPRAVVVGVDDGYTDPFSAHRYEFDHDGRAHAATEVYRSRMTLAEKIAAVRMLTGDRPIEVVVDSAAAGLVAEFRAAGLDARGVDKSRCSVFEGVTQVVAPRLQDAGDGMPRLTVDPSCTELIREFETYEWKPGRDEPVDAHNHALDELRYVLMERDRGGAVACGFAGVAEDAGVGSDDGWVSAW